MNKLTPYVLFCITLAAGLINLDWGLQTRDRFIQVFGTVENFHRIQKEYKEKQAAGTLIYYDEMVHGRSNMVVQYSYAGDEHFVMESIKNLDPKKLQFDPRFYMYGGGFIYTEAAFLQLAAWLNYIKIVRDFDYYKTHPEQIGRAYYVFRLAVVLFGTVGIMLMWWLAGRCFGPGVGLLTWILLMGMPLTHQVTHTAEPHIFVLPLFLLSLCGCLRSLSGGLTRNHVLAAVFAGFAIGTQATSLYIVCPFFMALLLNMKQKRISLPGVLKHLCLYTAVSLAAFFLLNPFYLLNLQGLSKALDRGTGLNLFQGMKLWADSQLSWPLLIVFCVAIIYGLLKCRGSRTMILLMSCIVPAVITYFITNAHMPYVYAGVAVLGAVSARMLIDLYRRLPGNVRAAAVAAALVLFLIFPVGRSTYYLVNFTASNHDAAGHWINKNVSAGTTIGIRFPPSLWDCVPFNYHNYRLVDYHSLTPDSPDLPAVLIAQSNSSIPESIAPLYEAVKTYPPPSLFGVHYRLKGELLALIARTTVIYRLRTDTEQ